MIRVMGYNLTYFNQNEENRPYHNRCHFVDSWLYSSIQIYLIITPWHNMAKGYVWGSMILLLIGLVLIYFELS